MQRNVIKKREGQMMIMSTILIGGALFATTAIVGYVLLLQIRQAGDSLRSATAFYAADSGIEEAMYCYYKREFTQGEEISAECGKTGDVYTLSKNGGDCEGGDCKRVASYSVNLSCFTDLSNKTVVAPCADGSSNAIKGIYIFSSGSASRTERALDYTVITASGN